MNNEEKKYVADIQLFFKIDRALNNALSELSKIQREIADYKEPLMRLRDDLESRDWHDVMEKIKDEARAKK